MLLDVDKRKLQWGKCGFQKKSFRFQHFEPIIWCRNSGRTLRLSAQVCQNAAVEKPLGWQPAGGWSGQLNIPGSKPQTRMSWLPTNPPAPFCNSFSAICTWKISFSCFQVQTSHSSLSNTRTSFHVFSKRDQRGRLTRRFKDFSVTLLLTVSVKYTLEHFLTDPIRWFCIFNSTCLV